MAKKCFVIQPFDGGDKFDKRYKDVFSPAIEEAGLVPYRVDHDPQSVFPNEDIRNGILEATACLADITLDNFNVGVEIGIAVTLGKDPVLVCSDERKGGFPFDVQDRSIISYKTDSKSDFEVLHHKIVEQLKARLDNPTLQRSVISMGDSLDQYEFSTLLAISDSLSYPNGVVYVGYIRDRLSQQYYDVTVTMSLKSLFEKGFITEGMDREDDPVYGLTDKGWQWMRENKSLFTLDKPQRESKKQEPKEEGFGDMEDIPF